MSVRAFLGAIDPQGIGEAFLGARRGRSRGHGGGHHRSHGGGSPGQNRMSAAGYRANQAARFAMPDVPGVPSRDVAMAPAAWPLYTFALANGTNQQTQNMSPQGPFRGQRLLFQVIRNGTSAALTAPVVNFLQVGMKPLIMTSNGIACEWYSSTAVDTNLVFPPTIPGVNYSLTLSLPVALTTTDTLLVLSGINGTAIL